MEQLVRFFINRPKLNYTFAIFLAVMGILAYIATPKEIFPPMILKKLIISGYYNGASPDNLDKMAVSSIEDEIKNISGITKIESIIAQGEFKIIITLKDNVNLQDKLNKIKDAISKIKSDLPNDMDEPTVTTFEHKIPLMQVAIASKELSKDELLELAKKVKKEISKLPNITDTIIYGESNKEIKIKLDSKKIEAYNISKQELLEAISSISYIYPLGKIEQQGEHLYLRSSYEKKDAREYEKTLLKIGNKRLYLGDIAEVSIEYQKSQTLSSFNGENSFVINVSKDEDGNSIELSKKIKELLQKLQNEYPQALISYFSETSIWIKNRLNTVISNITLGFLLVTLSMYLLINARISLVVALGVPFSFLIGTIFLYLSGYSMNMITLLGALIAIGVLVDDAIVVSENIQRHIEEGLDPKEAAIIGAKEVMMPVIMATITTIFAFIPMLLLSGEMGVFIKMIPIAISVLLIASLIESFFFLPLHAKHLMKKEAKVLSWERANSIYKKILDMLIEHKRVSLILFILLVPLATFFSIMAIKFQFFPKFDGTEIYVSGKLNINNKLEDTQKIVQEIESKITQKKDEFYIKSIASVSGFRMDGSGMESENGAHLFMFFLTLHDPIEDNFIERYITPILSFEFDRSQKIRELKSYQIEELLRGYLSDIKSKYNLVDFKIEGQKAGVVKRDIELQLISKDMELIRLAINKLKDELSKIDGTKNIEDDLKDGISELRLKLNNYGKQLGVSESFLAKVISEFYLSMKVAKSFDENGIIEIKTEELDKDKFQNLLNFYISTPSGIKVALKDIIEPQIIPTIEKIKKRDGDRIYSIFCDVDTQKITATQVLKKLEPILDEIRVSGIEVKYGGEKEQNKKLAKEMMVASVIAIFLIFLALLYMFESFKNSIMILSVIPFSFLGVFLGHLLMGINLTMPSIIGILGLAGVVINDGIVMLDFIKNVKNKEELLYRASLRLRPIILTSLTTFIGLSTLIFFPSGQAKVLQPLAISLGFGLAWGTLLNLFYLPTLFALLNVNNKTHYPTLHNR